MKPLLTNLVESLPEDLIPDAQTWWIGLSADDRDDLSRLCDARKEVFLFETFSDGDDRPKVTGGKFIPHDDAVGFSEWGEDYFQYLLDHPELVLVFEPQMRTFHIGCSRHIAARRCFVAGVVTDTFRCPFDSDRCLMHSLLNGRSTVKLRPLRSGRVIASKRTI